MAIDNPTTDGTKLNLLHFNDVYRVTPQKINASSPETIDVTQFAWIVDDLRSKWPKREDGTPDGLLLFSGDVFSPSVESSVTRGSHMVSLRPRFGSRRLVYPAFVGSCVE